MYGPIGFYIDSDTAECETDHDPETWEGFEDWTEPLPIFPDTEADTPTHCHICGDLIPHNLTEYGIDYVVEHLTDVRGIFGYPRETHDDPLEPTPPRNAGVLEQWADRLDDLGYSVAANVGRALIAMASEPLAPETGPSAYRLAWLADTPSPDSPDSAGAQFLNAVFTDVIEVAIDEPDASYPEDLAAGIADRAVPVYTRELWDTFIDLGAWGEDVEDLGPIESLEGGARAALYMVAERLARMLLEGVAERFARMLLEGGDV